MKFNLTRNSIWIPLVICFAAALLLYNLFVLAADNSYGMEDASQQLLFLSSLQLILPVSIFLMLIVVFTSFVLIYKKVNGFSFVLPNYSVLILSPLILSAFLFLIDFFIPSSPSVARNYAESIYHSQDIYDEDTIEALASMSVIQQAWVGLLFWALIYSGIYYLVLRFRTKRMSKEE